MRAVAAAAVRGARVQGPARLETGLGEAEAEVDVAVHAAPPAAPDRRHTNHVRQLQADRRAGQSGQQQFTRRAHARRPVIHGARRQLDLEVAGARQARDAVPVHGDGVHGVRAEREERAIELLDLAGDPVTVLEVHDIGLGPGGGCRAERAEEQHQAPGRRREAGHARPAGSGHRRWRERSIRQSAASEESLRDCRPPRNSLAVPPRRRSSSAAVARPRMFSVHSGPGAAFRRWPPWAGAWCSRRPPGRGTARAYEISGGLRDGGGLPAPRTGFRAGGAAVSVAKTGDGSPVGLRPSWHQPCSNTARGSLVASAPEFTRSHQCGKSFSSLL